MQKGEELKGEKYQMVHTFYGVTLLDANNSVNSWLLQNPDSKVITMNTGIDTDNESKWGKWYVTILCESSRLKYRIEII